MHNPAEVLAAGGPLAQHIPDFSPRVPQQEMAVAVSNALNNQGSLITEAGTGTGKTFAYLVPALLAGNKIIISTGTKTLQDQLYHRDLPVVRDALSISVKTALLKGRANYLCQHRLEVAASDGRFRSRFHIDALQRIREWAGRTTSGDIAEVTEVQEDSSVWPVVTSTAENCLGQECDYIQECHVMKARRAAQEADVLVINHYLMFADMALKEEGFGELLPGANAFILDEAHQLPEVATSFFGISVSSRQLLELARDVQAEHIKEAGDMQDLPEAREKLEKAIQDFRLSMGNNIRRISWNSLIENPKVETAFHGLQKELENLCQWLEIAASRGKGLENCWRRNQEFIEKLEMLMRQDEDEHIHWIDIHKLSFSMHLTPLDIAKGFQTQMQAHPCSWIFTSATLAIGNSFNHFAKRMGIEDAETQQLSSTFDYKKNALLYLPNGMPEPNDPEYVFAVLEAAIPVINASKGRAFMLFTSHRALKEAAKYLETRISYPLLVQGDLPRAELLERFREKGNAVLLGTNSFWEGVDVKGPALSCVIIDKLPFASPGDPILQARIDMMRNKGANPFMEYQLPNAVIALKQGVGRLIRDENDHGVMMLCDPRLKTKAYGKTFLKSLPQMPQTNQLETVQGFFESTVPLEAEV